MEKKFKRGSKLAGLIFIKANGDAVVNSLTCVKIWQQLPSLHFFMVGKNDSLTFYFEK